MKTLKFALIAVLIAGTMVSMANADGFKGKVQPIPVINVTIERAVHITGLAAAMYDQLDPGYFLNGGQHDYVAEVFYLGTKYRISGTAGQWLRFFKMRGELPFDTRSPILRDN